RSAEALPSRLSASRPLAASPTISSGMAAEQSSSSSRRRRRAGASSSTISTLIGASGMACFLLNGTAIRHADMHLVAVLVDLALEACLGIEMQCETLADVGDRHLVAAVMAPMKLIGVAQDRVHLAAAYEDVDRDHARC